MSDPEPTEETPAECPQCKLRRDNFQAVGLAIFFISLFSCGTLTFIALPTGGILTMLGSRKCKACRAAAKSGDKPTAATDEPTDTPSNQPPADEA